MIHTGEKYINPLTDFGFKRIFGTPFNSDLLTSFLNAVLDGERNIVEVKYNNSEMFGSNEEQRKAVFDVYCTTNDGSRFIVEMQNVYQDFYKDRSIYYSTFPITEQAKKGDWNYELQPVYTVGILNFTFPEDKKSDDSGVFREVKLMDINRKEIFYDKLTYIYIELANFSKELEECKTMMDKWLFCLKNMSNLLERPTELQGRVFEKLFKTAEIAKFKPMELKAYEQSINAYRDIKNGMDAAKREGFAIGKKEGRAEGREEGRAEGIEEGESRALAKVVRNMRKMGLTDQQIAEATNLSLETILKVKE
ncbi:MAG: Rpn family recombination-promoting nuclease/putative transposase [Prevotellaceae bacterium]|nr:Rpn family recombination-promoting nuclease/putative transposase [Prevotellaceae bacterium]